jgi:hypothetical protein
MTKEVLQVFQPVCLSLMLPTGFEVPETRSSEDC